MKGWSRDEWSTIRVSKRDQTKEVMRVANEVGYSLTENVDLGNGLAGQFHASHAEEQFIAYFLDRHGFLLQ